MKVNFLILSFFTVAIAFSQKAFSITPTVRPVAAAMPFLLVKNNNDNNYFVTPLGGLDPRMSGSNRWTGLKYIPGPGGKQQSLGYIDNGYNTGLTANYYFDMWLDNLPFENPLSGLRCINWYNGCNAETSLILPQLTDNSGFYGVIVPPGGQKWMHGMMTDRFYDYLDSMAVGETLTFTINACQTALSYNANRGQRCSQQSSGYWYQRQVSHTKAAQLTIFNTGGLSEVLVNSDGLPILTESENCRLLTIAKVDGISCKMVSYQLEHNSLSNTTVGVFPAVTDAALAAKLVAADVKFSLDNATWTNMSADTYVKTFNELKNSNSIYIFFSSNFFKKLVSLGMSDQQSQNLINIRFKNTTSPESGWYEFSTANTLIIKPRDYGVSIHSDDGRLNPSRTGYAGKGEPPLKFGYYIRTSAKSLADQLRVKVSGPEYKIDGRSYCLFSSEDKRTQVPFPARLAIETEAGRETFEAGCNNRWFDITDVIRDISYWADSSGDRGYITESRLDFFIIMDDPASLKTISNEAWYEDISASGEIVVEATWKNIQ